MLEDRQKDLIYVPVSRRFYHGLIGWSKPVQIRFMKPTFDSEAQLEVRELKDCEHCQTTRMTYP